MPINLKLIRVDLRAHLFVVDPDHSPVLKQPRKLLVDAVTQFPDDDRLLAQGLAGEACDDLAGLATQPIFPYQPPSSTEGGLAHGMSKGREHPVRLVQDPSQMPVTRRRMRRLPHGKRTLWRSTSTS